MGSTRRYIVLVIVSLLGVFAVGTATSQARSASPNAPATVSCRALHVGAERYCKAIEHRHAIRIIRKKERREAARAAVPLKISHRPLSWKVGTLWRQNHWERHRLAHLEGLPSSYCTGETGNRLIGCQIVLARGWSAGQWQMLDWQWGYESGWQTSDPNSLGCDGIPQACPFSKMGCGHDDAVCQIRWGLDYIDGRYGSIEAAYHVERTQGWY